MISVNCLGLKQVFFFLGGGEGKEHANCNLPADFLFFSFQTVFKYLISEHTYLHHSDILLRYAVIEDVFSITAQTRLCVCL